MGYLEVVTKDNVYDIDFCSKYCRNAKEKKAKDNCVCTYSLTDRIHIQNALAYLQINRIPLALAIPRED